MLLSLALACAGSTTEYQGLKMSDYFSLDGNRLATYNNEDTTVTWQLVVEKKEQTSQRDGREIVTFEYSRSDTFEILGSVEWSTVPGDEVMVHGYSLGATGELLEFDPPVAITETDDAMRTGDAVVTETEDSAGTPYTFTSTYVEMVPECPTTFSDDFSQCAHMTIDDGDGDDTFGPLFTGDFVFVSSWGPAFMTIPISGAAGEWGLTRYDYDAGE